MTIRQRLDTLLSELRYRFGRRSPERPPCLACEGTGHVYNSVGWQTCRACGGTGAAA